ncbi:hypothetical protein P692DRAFT_201223495 [Suillus brevipes Sb2]|nr:hypothetical protein P692DRAFT_201223495 [Suillus brevipes Sb2]
MMQRWSFMTVLYICVRYIGILYSVVTTLGYLPISMTNVVGFVLFIMWAWIPVIVNAMLGVIMMIRIHAMYQRSKKMLIFLIVVLLACTITSGIIMVMANIGVSAEEFIIDGRPACLFNTTPDQVDLFFESLMPTAIWEILASVLALWIVIKHFRELRNSATGSIIGDCFTVLTKSHAFYFGAFAIVACLNLGSLSPYVTYSSTLGTFLYVVVQNNAQTLQMFVLGPRLILSLREYHAKLVARSDGGTGMTSIYFQAQAGGDASAGGEV